MKNNKNTFLLFFLFFRGWRWGLLFSHTIYTVYIYIICVIYIYMLYILYYILYILYVIIYTFIYWHGFAEMTKGWPHLAWPDSAYPISGCGRLGDDFRLFSMSCHGFLPQCSPCFLFSSQVMAKIRFDMFRPSDHTSATKLNRFCSCLCAVKAFDWGIEGFSYFQDTNQAFNLQIDKTLVDYMTKRY